MIKYDLSIIIPARNEEWLAKTVETLLENIEGNTEIIIIEDGQWSSPGIPQDPRVTVVFLPESIGQRAAINLGVKLSSAKYIMKLDAHCWVSKGFDRELMSNAPYEYTIVPRMYNLHVFNWVCRKCGNKWYQGPQPKHCMLDKSAGKVGRDENPDCDNTTEFDREVVWKPKKSPETDAMLFDTNLQFKYWSRYKRRQDPDINKVVPTMSCLGACFFMHRERFWETGGCDEGHGSWGQQGTEHAMKAWTGPGKDPNRGLYVNRKASFAHMFRTQDGFKFPYPMTNEQQEFARQYSQKIWKENAWPLATRDLNWVLEKFKPIPYWHDQEQQTEDLKAIEDELGIDIKPSNKEIIYYTCNTHLPEIDEACRRQLKKSAGNIPIISVSLNKSLDFGDTRLMIKGEKSPLMMHKQILAGLEVATADIIYLCESDVLYDPSHFDFIPPRDDVFYYNENTYKVDYETGQAVFYYTKQVSGLCAKRELLIEFYEKKIKQIESDGFNRHYEPGQKASNDGIFPRESGGKYGWERRMSQVCNVDIRHNANITKTKWSIDEFKDVRNAQGWTLVDEIPNWGKTKGRFKEFLAQVVA